MKIGRALLVCLLAAGMAVQGGTAAAAAVTDAADETAAVEEDTENTEEENSVAATVNGVEIPASEVEAIANYMLAQYESAGYDTGEEALQEYVSQASLQLLIQMEVLKQKAAELGLDVFTEEELAELEELAEETAELYGYEDVSIVLEDLENGEIFSRLEEACVADITISDEEVKAQYDAYVEMDTENFADNVALYEQVIAAYGTNDSYYMPEGYRYLTYIRLSAEEDNETVQEQILEIQTKFAEGTSFSELIQEYSLDGEDAGVSVHKDSVLWEEALVEAAMAIEEIGQISEPAECSDGIYILYYDSDIEGGALPYTESVKESLYAEMLASAQDSAFSSMISGWCEESDIQYN